MIPFVQGLPDGRRVAIQIKRLTAIEELAQEFMGAGGRYLLEQQPNDMVKLMAIIDLKDGCAEVATEFCRNGIELPRAVDRLVEESFKQLKAEIPSVSMIVPREKRLIIPQNDNQLK